MSLAGRPDIRHQTWLTRRGRWEVKGVRKGVRKRGWLKESGIYLMVQHAECHLHVPRLSKDWTLSFILNSESLAFKSLAKL